ncbi:hypothetical protein Dimus_030324, partial [Dionaea muscipula]
SFSLPSPSSRYHSRRTHDIAEYPSPRSPSLFQVADHSKRRRETHHHRRYRGLLLAGFHHHHPPPPSPPISAAITAQQLDHHLLIADHRQGRRTAHAASIENSTCCYADSIANLCYRRRR